MWDRPSTSAKRAEVQFDDDVQIRYLFESSSHDLVVKLNDPDHWLVPGMGLDIDALAGYENDEYSGMQIRKEGVVSSRVMQRVDQLWNDRMFIYIRLWFIDHSGFGTAATVYKKISNKQQLESILEQYSQQRDVHLVHPNPSNPRYPANVHVLLSKNAFSAYDILVEVIVDGIHETMTTARVRGDTVREVYRDAGYSRWLHNPRFEFLLYDEGCTLHLDDEVQLYQGAFVVLHVRSLQVEEDLSDSQGSTDCPEDGMSSTTESEEAMSLLQFLADHQNNPTERHHWFDESPCQFDRWCGSQNNGVLVSHKPNGQGQMQQRHGRQWMWLRKCRAEEVHDLNAHLDGEFEDEGEEDELEDMSEDDFEWVRLNGEGSISLKLQSEEAQAEDSLLIVSFGIKDDDKGRKDGQLFDLTLSGLKHLLWELWQDEVEQFGVMQVLEATPQPLEELGLNNALIVVVTLNGVRRQGVHVMCPTLNFVQYRTEGNHGIPYTKHIRTPIDYEALLSEHERHDECEPFGMRPCTLTHAGERVLETRPCHIVAGGVTKLIIADFPFEFQRVRDSIRGYEEFVRHARSGAQRYGNRVTIVVHRFEEQPGIVESFDLMLLRPVHILNHPVLGGLVGHGSTYYQKDSEVYRAAEMPEWCYHFLHVPQGNEGNVDVMSVLRSMNARGTQSQSPWGVVRFRRRCTMLELGANLRAYHLLDREGPFRILLRRHEVRQSDEICSGDTIMVRIDRLSERSRSRSNNRQTEGDLVSDDMSLLQFLDRVTHLPWSEGKRCSEPEKKVARSDCRTIISLEKAIPNSQSKFQLTLYDKLWPESVHVKNVLDSDDETITELHQALELLQMDQWQGLNTNFDAIPNLHPSAKCAIQMIGMSSLTRHLHIYTDGSAKNGVASWAFVVLCQVGHAFRCVGFAGGIVDDSIGKCEHLSNDAEATAIIAMSEFVLSLGTFVQTVHCYCDSLAVGFGTDGNQSVVTNQDMPAARQEGARVLLSLLQSKYEVTMRHVHAHVGNPFNECADSIAAAVRKGWKCEKPTELRSRALLHHPLRRWAWIDIAPTAMMPSLREILTQHVVPRSEQDPDPALVVGQECTDDAIRVTLKVATANVATMHYNKGSEGCMSTKANELAYQFHNSGYDVVAFQETRASITGARHLGNWLRIISASCKGHGGVEIWLNTDSEFFRVLGFQINTQDVLVWHSDDRILALQIQWPGGGFHVISVYAPQSGSGSHSISAWWSKFEQILKKKPSHAPVIVLGDCNGRVGSVTSDSIGDLAADIEDEAGALFRSLCEKQEWIVPSTHDAFHRGKSETYIAPRAHLSRLDYIAVSKSCQNGIEKSWIDDDIDLLNGENDHNVVSLQLSLTARRKQCDHITKVAIYDRANAKVSNAHVTIPEVNWNVEVNQHWACVCDNVQQQCKRLYPKPKRVQRQLYFSERAWQQLCHRKDLRREVRRYTREERWHFQRIFFKAWAEKQDSLKEQHRRSMHVCRLQIALTLNKQIQAEHLFRKIKKEDWKEWAVSRMRNDVEEANKAKGSDLFRILQPKRAIQRAKFGAHSPLPGMKDKTGTWCQDRQSIALAWESQFSQLENADKTTINELWDRSRPCHKNRCVHELLEIPDLFDFEEALRSMNPAKAPGVDAIGAEIWRQNVAISARRLFPLLLKGALNEQWIVEFSGGWLLPLWKKKGSAQQMETYRGILLEPVLGRAISRAWRKRLVDSADGWAAMMQWGGRSGLSIEALHLHARL